jgi:flagellar motor switch protein FliM
MSSASALTGEEVAALIDGIAEHDAAHDKGPRPFTFGADASRPLAAIPALDRMNERAARALKARIEPISRLKPRVTAEPVAVRRFDAWKAEQPEFTSVGLYRFRPLKGGLLVAIAPNWSAGWLMLFTAAPEFIVNGLLRNSPPQRSVC